MKGLSELVASATGLRLGVNKSSELSRLVFEIHRRENVPPETILAAPGIRAIVETGDLGYHDKFARIKAHLLARRFPRAYREPDFAACLNRLADPAGTARVYGGPFLPEAIVIEEHARTSPLARRVVDRFPGLPVTTVTKIGDYRKTRPVPAFDPRKRELFISRQKWDFVKPCPCSKGVQCCDYHVVNLGFGCPFDCSYCYLQHYANFPGIVLDANIEDFFPELERCLARFRRTVRIGTGEFTDSLALNDLTGYAEQLIAFFSDKNVLFELKTKSANIDAILAVPHNGKTVISWSLNPPSVVAREERGAASLADRFSAARKCRQAGYGVGFHFDPIFLYDGWEKEYGEVVNAMFDAVGDPAWISLGTFRFHRSLKSIIEQRFPESTHIYGEMVIGHDGKLRYPAALRGGMYRKMTESIKRRNPGTALYLCMESPEMWENILGREKPFWMS